MVRESATIGVLVCLALLAGVASCEIENFDAELDALDENAFRCEVEPVLMARCGFYACHGSERRPFHIYAPNRLRIEPSVPQLAIPLSEQERAANYAAAVAMAQGVDEPLLLFKPLDVDVGGLFHKGKSLYRGRDSFVSVEDEGFTRIARWLDGHELDADCQVNSEVGP